MWCALHESENEVLVDYLRFSAREPKRNAMAEARTQSSEKKAWGRLGGAR